MLVRHLELAARRYCDCPTHGSAPEQGWGFDQCDLMKGGCNKMNFKVHSKKKHSIILGM